ncbi:putative sugar phosphate/phosphate translocator [Drosera capensis]
MLTFDSALTSPSIHRDPSFSGWCDNNNQTNADRNIESSAVKDRDEEDEGEEESGFELKVSDRDRRRLLMEKESSDVGEGEGRRDRGKYAVFEVQRGAKSDRRLGGFEDVVVVVEDSKGRVSAGNVLRTICFVLVWYIFSMFLTLYNKSLLGDKLGKFPAPLLMNTFHFAMQAILSRAITWLWSDRFRTGVQISWRDYLSRVVPTALATALDINLSNESLVFITVTFATMCKSASPIYLLLFAFAFRLESPSLKLLGIILVISFGVLLTVAKETEFEFWGFLFVMLAAVMSGFRWCMMQILLQREAYGLKNPITFMSSVTPVMAIATALFSLLMDPWHDFANNDYFNSTQNIIKSCLLMLFGGTLAFFMVLTEYVLVSMTSAVTVTIAGVVKEAVTIIVAIFYFHDQFTWMKGFGLFTILIGVSLFNWFKYELLKKGHTSENSDGPDGTNVPARYVILEEADDHDDGV